MRRIQAGSLILGVLILATIAVVTPAAGKSLTQPEQTAQVQTIDAYVRDSLTQTAAAYSQTQAVAATDIYATAQAQFAPGATSTPASGVDASATSRAVQAMGRGWIYYWQGENFDAIRAFTDAIEAVPNWAEGYVGRGLVYVSAHQNSAALEDFDRAIQLDDDAGLYASLRAYVLIALGEYNRAIADCTRAIELNPRSPVAYHNRAYAYASTARYDEALADYARAIALDPSDPISYGNRAEIYRDQGNWQLAVIDSDLEFGLKAAQRNELNDAVSYFMQVINKESSVLSLDPRLYAYAHYNLGLLQIRFGNPDLALQEFDEAITLAPDFAHAYTAQGHVYAGQGQWEMAFERYNAALAVDPSFSSGYLKRAIAHNAVGDQAAAASDYWDWIRLMQTRDMEWEYARPGESFVIDLEESWAYYIPFQGIAGQLFSATAELVPDARGDADPLIVLLDADGNPLAANDNALPSSPNAALDEVVLPADGEYTLVVSHSSGYGGPVSVTFTPGRVLPAPEQTATVQAYTPTFTRTPTPTATLTPTETAIPTATATADTAGSKFELLGSLPGDFNESADWQDGLNIITVSSWDGIRRHDASRLNSLPVWISSLDTIARVSAVNPSGTLLALAQRDITILDLSTGKPIAVLQGHSQSVMSVAFSPDGSLLASGGLDGMVWLWDVSTFKPTAAFEVGELTAGIVAFDPRGTWLAVALAFRDDIQLWDITNPAEPTLFTTLGTDELRDMTFHLTNLIAYSPDGSILASVTADGDIQLWDTTTLTPIATLAGHITAVNCLSFSSDGTLLASGSEDKTVRIWYVPYRTEVAVLGGPMENAEVSYVSFSPTEPLLLALYADYRVKLWGLPPTP
jgi:tetratricopeptide (TPR) repeat protein